jgi:hypothetical protein
MADLPQAERSAPRARSSIFEDREVGGIGDQIAGFFDGRQIDPAASEMTLSKGYCL